MSFIRESFPPSGLFPRSLIHGFFSRVEFGANVCANIDTFFTTDILISRLRPTAFSLMSLNMGGISPKDSSVTLRVC